MIAALLLAAGLSPELAATLARAAEADLRLRGAGTCAAGDLDLVRTAVRALAPTEPPKSAKRLRFPVDRVKAATSIGGTNGSGWVLPRGLRCYADANSGHPAHDLFVDDPDQDARDGAGSPWPVLAVEDGVVPLTHEGWRAGDPLKGGNFVMLYLPARGQLAYYAHLETVAVRAGEQVTRGAPLGHLGRTGRNAWPKRSPTHLHFALIDAATLRPVNPYRLLRAAED